MNLTLKLRYHTTAGQSLWVTGNHSAFGAGDLAKAIPLHWLNDQIWQASIPFPSEIGLPKDNLVYNYILRNPDGSTISDLGSDHVLHTTLFNEEDAIIVDSWNDEGFPENAFYTEPFKNVLLRANQTQFVRPAPARTTHIFKVKAPLLAQGQVLALLGNTDALGSWDTTNPVLLNRHPSEDQLIVGVDLGSASLPIEYKYGVFDLKKNSFVAYEAGTNRRLDEPSIAGRQIIVNDGFAAFPADTWKGAGVAIPVFSLRSEHSFGIGEFNDLKPLADWCQQTGLKLIQILPVNDTTSTHTWADSYPYSAISAFALNPVYVNLAEVAAARNKGLLKNLEVERKRLNSLPELDYAAVMSVKLAFLKQIFPSQKAATFRRKDYQSFVAGNQHWLKPYAAFCLLRDKFGTAYYDGWPSHRRCTPEAIASFTAEDSPDFDSVALHYFIQFHLHAQLQSAAAYAHERGVILKGDIPIGVSRYGVDTWESPELYILGVQAGAPPDPFAEKGQNWGFPTYDWARMTKDGFAWWKQRFAQMSDYFDAFRIDHILGFFRIWSIPAHAIEGILGYFVPAIPVEREEFVARGISFNQARMVEPFITDDILFDFFGIEADRVKQTFLQAGAPGQYALLSAFATQRQVEQYFSKLETGASNQKLKQGLFDLISNVLLFEVRGSQGRQFHFRFHMEKTASYRNLDSRTQTVLRELYVDYFFRRQDAFWMKEAMHKLPTLKRVTNMLICGEDLGLVPACVPDVMKSLGLLGLEIQRMPKTPGLTFSRPSAAPYLSVVTPSTHDMSTIRGWWLEDSALTQRFYHEELGLSGPAPASCSAQLNEAVVRQHLASPAMWSIFQLQDLLGMDDTLRRSNPKDERINIPANSNHYWRFRMHITLDSLLHAEGFTQQIRHLIRQHGRE